MKVWREERRKKGNKKNIKYVMYKYQIPMMSILIKMENYMNR